MVNESSLIINDSTLINDLIQEEAKRSIEEKKEESMASRHC